MSRVWKHAVSKGEDWVKVDECISEDPVWGRVSIHVREMVWQLQSGGGEAENLLQRLEFQICDKKGKTSVKWNRAAGCPGSGVKSLTQGTRDGSRGVC